MVVRMEWIFETKDREGVIVRMSKDTYERHLPIHPEIADYIEEAELTVQDPELIIRDDDNCYHHYRLGLGRGKYKKCYVRVLVNYRHRRRKKEGIVSSYWLSRTVGEGEVIWMKKLH